MTGQSRVRLIDVADHLGVAPSTVSRALAGADSIPEATRQRVQDAARELGYRANPAAAGLKRGVTMNLGLIASLGGSWYSGALAAAADSVAADAGYDFVVVTAEEVEGDSGLLARAERLGQRVDGVIIVDVTSEADLLSRLIDRLGVPVVTIGCSHSDWPLVAVDNVAVGRAAAEHLVELGHQRLTTLRLETPNEIAIDNTTERVAGFASSAGDRKVVECSLGRGPAIGRRASIIEATEGSTGIFCTSDELAIEVMAVLGSIGRRVPGDVSVVGVDNHPLADAVGLTTVVQEPRRSGQSAAETLLGLVGGDIVPVRSSHATHLEARATTGAPVN